MKLHIPALTALLLGLLAPGALQESSARGQARTYAPEDYFLAFFLIGWEVWGAFNADVEFKDLSLRGKPAR